MHLLNFGFQRKTQILLFDFQEHFNLFVNLISFNYTNRCFAILCDKRFWNSHAGSLHPLSTNFVSEGHSNFPFRLYLHCGAKPSHLAVPCLFLFTPIHRIMCSSLYFQLVLAALLVVAFAAALPNPKAAPEPKPQFIYTAALPTYTYYAAPYPVVYY